MSSIQSTNNYNITKYSNLTAMILYTMMSHAGIAHGSRLSPSVITRLKQPLRNGFPLKTFSTSNVITEFMVKILTVCYSYM